ncbi:MAG: hypothetical protein R3E01_21190 [Pirellulaceae bacterium]|nr:hypothetical protein [Planctomycetales bacterium]
MTDIREMELQRWTSGMPTKYPPADELFLRAATDAGFEAFTHVGGLFGAQAANRAVQIIHRGRGRKWEVIFMEHDADMVTTTTTDLEQMTITMLSWLSGRSLTAKEDSVRAVAG